MVLKILSANGFQKELIQRTAHLYVDKYVF